MILRPTFRTLCFLVLAFIGPIAAAVAQPGPQFINGIVIEGGEIDATREPGANDGRFGFFSDLYYDPALNQWWALSDRGPGGGTLPYDTRLQRIALNVHPVSGEISRFRILDTIKFSDPDGLLNGPSDALDGLNPFSLTGNASNLANSFDPEGLAVHPVTGHFFVADEYGPSLYEFDRKGRLVKVFEVPANLVPKVGGAVNYVALRDACGGSVPAPLCGANAGRQDNRGYEGLALSPDGNTLYAVLQDPLINEPGPNNGRSGRNVRIIVFSNDPDNAMYGKSTAQYIYQLELQADILARIKQGGGAGSDTDPRQGRNIGLSAITALNDREFLVLERDNRGIGVDDPRGANVVGSKRIYKIRITSQTTNLGTALLPLDGNLAGAGIVPVEKSAHWIDLALHTLLPNGKQAEKWEGMTIGPKLAQGGYVLVFGNDNDYSVTQDANTNLQFDIHVDFAGNFARCVLDNPKVCQINGAGPANVQVPAGYSLIPGVLHAYAATEAQMQSYVEPGTTSKK